MVNDDGQMMDEIYVNDAAGDGDNKQRHRPIISGEQLDIEAYASLYSGRTKIMRLLFIADRCGDNNPTMQLEALRMAYGEIKKGDNTQLYRDAAQRIDGRLGSGYGMDSSWVEAVERRAEQRREKLENELNAYKTNLIKESIRMGYNDLGDFHYAHGQLADAFKNYIRARDYCTTGKHIVNMCLNAILVSIEMGQFSHVTSYVSKAEQTPEALDPIIVAKLRCAAGLAHLESKKYKLAARKFLEVGPELANNYSDVLAPQDVATYGGLCALATFDRTELKNKVIDNLNFRNFLELVPEIRELISDFYSSHYASCLDYLGNLKANLLLDIHLHDHVETLYNEIRHKALIQYTLPFVSVDLNMMANAFKTSVAGLQKELEALITNNQIQGKDATLNPSHPALMTWKASTLNDALQKLIECSKSNGGRSDLASKSILPSVLQLVKSLTPSSGYQPLLLSLRLLRNLNAGEPLNQDSFIEHNGVEVVLNVINAVGSDDSGISIIRAALQVLANVSLAGGKHQRAIWNKLFPDAFLKIARGRRRDTCDPLSMIIYTCTDGCVEAFNELCGSSGLAIMAEIIGTASEADYGEDWLKLLLSRICLEECHFLELFNTLNQDAISENVGNAEREIHFTSKQAFVLQTVSEILNERLTEIKIRSDFAFHVHAIFERAAKSVDFNTQGESSLPTGHASIDVLGYSLSIIRDICAQGTPTSTESPPEDIVSSFVSWGLLDLLLSFLRQLELPSSIKKTMQQVDNQGLTSQPRKVCPYKGFRRDIVAVIGNCAYGRKAIQDEVRQKDGVFLLLQQCVIDEDNPFLREWGIWCASNLLSGNAENQQLVASLEMQETVDVPELAQLGLRVEVDPNTRQAKLVNIT